MPEAPRRERRSPMVMLLDAAMRLALAAQVGPEPKLRPAGRTRRVGVGWLVAGAVLAVAGTGIVIGALVTGRYDLASLPPHAAARQPAAAPVPGTGPESARPATTGPAPATSATGSPAASATASASAGPSTTAPGAPSAAAPVPLTAAYAYSGGGTGLLGYEAEVSVRNPGGAARDGWQVTLTLPRPTLQVADVSGAVVRQDGATWTFEPDATTRTVPPGGTVRVSFAVRGATLLAAAPRDCRIDGRPCTGLDDPATPAR